VSLVDRAVVVQRVNQDVRISSVPFAHPRLDELRSSSHADDLLDGLAGSSSSMISPAAFAGGAFRRPIAGGVIAATLLASISTSDALTLSRASFGAHDRLQRR